MLRLPKGSLLYGCRRCKIVLPFLPKRPHFGRRSHILFASSYMPSFVAERVRLQRPAMRRCLLLPELQLSSTLREVPGGASARMAVRIRSVRRLPERALPHDAGLLPVLRTGNICGDRRAAALRQLPRRPSVARLVLSASRKGDRLLPSARAVHRHMPRGLDAERREKQRHTAHSPRRGNCLACLDLEYLQRISRGRRIRLERFGLRRLRCGPLQHWQWFCLLCRLPRWQVECRRSGNVQVQKDPSDCAFLA